MKMVTKTSVLLNVVLAGVVIYVWANPPRQGTAPAAPAPRRLERQAQAAVPAPALGGAREAVEKAMPFRWSQLLAANQDYRVFVANLRAAGCPETTVGDIVRGDVERAFYAKRLELHIDGTQPGLWSGRSQVEMADYLLGQTPAVAGEPAAAGPSDQQPAGPATLAAFLQNADLTAPGLNQEQNQQMAGLRQNLLDQISQPNQAPGNRAVAASQPAVNGTPSPLAGTDGTPSSAAPTDSAQDGTDNTQPRLRPGPSQSMLMAEEAESVLGGLFGMGAAIQYDQYQAGSQSPQN
ncbi:MAG: hypothetical protein ABSE16_16705 [Verrucomicrobiota bacterium]|jgi:hypothetical protein